jgi:hypothetical protein
MRARSRLLSVERRAVAAAPAPVPRCAGCGQAPGERLPWAVGPIFPTCPVCGAAEVTLACLRAYQAGRRLVGAVA